jgi:hypothetical protein
VNRAANSNADASFELDFSGRSFAEGELVTLSFANFAVTAGVTPDPARLAAVFVIGADNAESLTNIQPALNELAGITVTVATPGVDGKFTVLFSASPAQVVSDFKVDLGKTTFTFAEKFGSDEVFSTGTSDVLDFSSIQAKVAASAEDNDGKGTFRTYSYTDSENNVHKVKAYGTFSIIGLAAGVASEAIWTGFRAAQNLEVFYASLVTNENSGTGDTISNITGLSALKAEAIARWEAVLPAAAVTDLQNITLTVSDITEAGIVAKTTSAAGEDGLDYTIILDNNAAGATWYVDQTPNDDNDDTNDGVYDSIDLLTVLMHEMGHVLGMDHPDFPTVDLLSENIEKGQRLLPTSDHFKSLSDQTKLSVGLGELATWSSNIGTKINEYLDDSTTIPFTNLSLSDLLGDKVTNLAGTDDTDGTIQTKVKAFVDAIDAYLLGNESAGTKDLLESLQETGADQGFNINLASSSSLKEFSVTITLETFSELVNLDLNELISFGDFEFDLPIDITQSQPLVISGGIDFMFNFGIGGDGDFYVRDPGLDAHFNFGEEFIDITGITAGSTESTAATISIAGDHVGAVKSTSAGKLMAGNTFYLKGSGNTDELYTVASISYDLTTDTTTITVEEDINAVDIRDEISGNLIKAVDFGVNFGPIGFDVTDAALSLGASVGIGFDGVLNYQDMVSDSTASLMGTPTLEGDAHYEVLLPVSLSGALDGFSNDVGFITATSSNLPDDATMGQFLGSIPTSVQFENLEEVFSMGGLSLDMIIGGVDDLLKDIVGTDKEVLGPRVGDTVSF